MLCVCLQTPERAADCISASPGTTVGDEEGAIVDGDHQTEAESCEQLPPTVGTPVDDQGAGTEDEQVQSSYIIYPDLTCHPSSCARYLLLLRADFCSNRSSHVAAEPFIRV